VTPKYFWEALTWLWFIKKKKNYRLGFSIRAEDAMKYPDKSQEAHSPL
jgi:hypothetical protein